MTDNSANNYYDVYVFKEIFGRDANDTIRAMDDASDDIANQIPSVAIEIDQVGCHDKKTYFRVEDPLVKGIQLDLYAKVHVGIAVPDTARGIHVSRLSDSIARISQDRVYKSVTDFARTLAKDIKQTQHAEKVHVKVAADYITPADVETVNGSPSKRTQDHFLLLGEAELGLQGEIITVGVEVNHITSCPCVQQTIRHATGNESELPLLTHSQRSITRVSLNNVGNELSMAELFKCIDATVFLARDTLPRPGEAALVFRSHEQPQFIEDVVRQVAHQLYVQFGDSLPEAGIVIKSRSLESIHTFDIVARLETSMKKFKALGISNALPDAKLNRKVVTRWSGRS